MSRSPRSSQHHRAPDPRGPLVLDIRPLGRRPGSMTEITREVPAPADLGTPMIGVPQGAPLALSARLESVVDGVLVTAEVTAPLHGECGRCLDEFDDEVTVHLQELFTYPERLAEMGLDEAGAEAEDIRLLAGDHLDLETDLRDALVLDLPLNPLCRDDCPGLTPTGERREDGAEDDAPVDPRWAALQGLVPGPSTDATSAR